MSSVYYLPDPSSRSIYSNNDMLRQQNNPQIIVRQQNTSNNGYSHQIPFTYVQQSQQQLSQIPQRNLSQEPLSQQFRYQPPIQQPQYQPSQLQPTYSYSPISFQDQSKPLILQQQQQDLQKQQQQYSQKLNYQLQNQQQYQLEQQQKQQQQEPLLLQQQSYKYQQPKQTEAFQNYFIPQKQQRPPRTNNELYNIKNRSKSSLKYADLNNVSNSNNQQKISQYPVYQQNPQLEINYFQKQEEKRIIQQTSISQLLDQQNSLQGGGQNWRQEDKKNEQIAPMQLHADPQYRLQGGEQSWNNRLEEKRIEQITPIQQGENQQYRLQGGGQNFNYDQKKNEGGGIRKCGLLNLGNTCYMNSALQCLFYTPELIDKLANYNSIYSYKRGLTFEIVNLYNQMNSNTNINSFESPENLKLKIEQANSQFKGKQQQDAQELLLYLLEGLHEELNKVKFKPQLREINTIVKINNNIPSIASQSISDSKLRENSLINEIFSGFFLSIVTCPCKAQSATFNSYMDISLSFPKEESGFYTYFFGTSPVDLLDLFKLFTEVEEHIENYTCSVCQAKNTVQKQLSLWSLPENLIINLKRFRQGPEGREKVQRKVKFPMILNLQPFLFGDSPNKQQDHIYELYSIINHQGSIFKGHYTAQCKNPIDQTWNEFNDSHCSQIDISLQKYDKEGSELPYILFYSKKKQN